MNGLASTYILGQCKSLGIHNRSRSTLGAQLTFAFAGTVRRGSGGWAAIKTPLPSDVPESYALAEAFTQLTTSQNPFKS